MVYDASVVAIMLLRADGVFYADPDDAYHDLLQANIFHNLYLLCLIQQQHAI